MKKIGVYLGNEPYCGGAFQYNQSILEALAVLDKNEFDIIAIYKDKLWEGYLRKFQFRNVRLLHSRWFNILSAVVKKILYKNNILYCRFKKFFSYIDILSIQIDRLKLDLVIFPSQEIQAAFQKTPAISVVHDLMHRYECFPELCEDGIAKGRDIAYLNMCESSKGIFVDSNVGKQHVIECYGRKYESKIFILPFTPPAYLFQAEAEKPCCELPDKYFFYPAQFWKHKNHENLIKAINLLANKGIFINFVFVGSKKNAYNDVCMLIEHFNLQNQVYILGYVSESSMKYLYEHARALVMPSFLGPTNIPPLEGMAMGCPVAVSNVYGMPEEVGSAGLVFDPHSVGDIANCLERLWLDDKLCDELAKAGYVRSEFFKQEKFNERLEEAINLFCD